MSYSRIGAAATILLLTSGVAMAAPEAYQVNLGPVARSNATKLLAVGKGDVTASLDGNKLSVKGVFTGLSSPATDAHLCVGVGIGTMGTCGSQTLTVSQATDGTISGDFTLTSAQVTAMKQGRLYIQLNSQKAPAPSGNLWGWFLIAHETVGQDVPQEGHWFLPQYDMPLSVEHGSTHELKPDTNS